jgi:hypothetical protein
MSDTETPASVRRATMTTKTIRGAVLTNWARGEFDADVPSGTIVSIGQSQDGPRVHIEVGDDADRVVTRRFYVRLEGEPVPADTDYLGVLFLAGQIRYVFVQRAEGK